MIFTTNLLPLRRVPVQGNVQRLEEPEMKTQGKFQKAARPLQPD